MTVELDGGARSFRTLARLDAQADVTVYRAGGLLQMMMAELAAGVAAGARIHPFGGLTGRGDARMVEP